MTKDSLAKKFYEYYKAHSDTSEDMVEYEELSDSEKKFLVSMAAFALPAFKRYRMKVEQLAKLLKEYYEPDSMGCSRCAVIDKLEQLSSEYNVK